MQSRGFTLIEALVVLTISAILVAMAIPSFQAMIQSNRISSAANAMLATLDLARSEAIRRNLPVTVCRSVDAATCSDAPFGGYAGNDWAAGWIVFAVAAANVPNGTVQAGDEIIVQQTPFQAFAPWRLIIESTVANQVRIYDARGLTLNGGPVGVTLFFDHRDTQVATRSNMARCIALNSSGRSRVARVVNDACPVA
jgi:type IV fimbrial biogenesis protein FimT